jgi:hypothetical protein
VRSQIVRQIANRRFKRRLGDTHYVVIRQNAFGPEIGQRDDRSLAVLHQRQCRLSDGNQRIGAHIQRDPEIVAFRVRVHALEGLTRRERQHMGNKIEVPDLLFNPFDKRLDLLVAPNVTLDQQRIVQLRRQFMDILAKSFILIGHDQPGPGPICRIGDAPRDATLISDAHDESGFSFEQLCHKGVTLP